MVDSARRFLGSGGRIVARETSDPVTTLKVAIASYKEMKARTMAVARGPQPAQVPYAISLPGGGNEPGAAGTDAAHPGGIVALLLNVTCRRPRGFHWRRACSVVLPPGTRENLDDPLGDLGFDVLAREAEPRPRRDQGLSACGVEQRPLVRPALTHGGLSRSGLDGGWKLY